MKVRPGNDKSVNHDGFSLLVESESWRFYAYLFFWGMCAFAIFLARVLVKPILLDGPADGSTCPPYSRVSYLFIANDFEFLHRNAFMTNKNIFSSFFQ